MSKEVLRKFGSVRSDGTIVNESPPGVPPKVFNASLGAGGGAGFVGYPLAVVIVAILTDGFGWSIKPEVAEAIKAIVVSLASAAAAFLAGYYTPPGGTSAPDEMYGRANIPAPEPEPKGPGGPGVIDEIVRTTKPVEEPPVRPPPRPIPKPNDDDGTPRWRIALAGALLLASCAGPAGDPVYQKLGICSRYASVMNALTEQRPRLSAADAMRVNRDKAVLGPICVDRTPPSARALRDADVAIADLERIKP